MKLDKWPETIECDGWRWRKYDGWEKLTVNVPAEAPSAKHFVAYEKLHTPPTMREIMEHLLNGGWVRQADYSNADYYYWMNADDELYYCFKKHGLLPELSKKHESGLSRFERSLDDWSLVNPYEWYK